MGYGDLLLARRHRRVAWLAGAAADDPALSSFVGALTGIVLVVLVAGRNVPILFGSLSGRGCVIAPFWQALDVETYLGLPFRTYS